MKKMLGIAFISAAALVLAACGSSDGDSAPVATTEVPSSATQNSAGLIVFINQQIGLSSDTSEPFLVGDAVLPLDDTTETSL